MFVMGSMIKLLDFSFEDNILILNQRHHLKVLNLWLAEPAIKFLLRALKELLELLLLIGKELGVVLLEFFSQLGCFVEALLADVEISDKQLLQRLKLDWLHLV